MGGFLFKLLKSVIFCPLGSAKIAHTLTGYPQKPKNFVVVCFEFLVSDVQRVYVVKTHLLVITL